VLIVDTVNVKNNEKVGGLFEKHLINV